MGSTIIGLGHYAPKRIVRNSELEVQFGLEPGWIERRVGIRERRWAEPEEALTDIAVRAGEVALANANVSRSDVALTLLATSTPDHLLPPSGPLLAHRLGLTGCGAVDLAGACAGFLYALAMADAYVRLHKRIVLVVAANILSRRIDMNERGTAILFADAAGAVVLAPSPRRDAGVLGVELASDGAAYDLIQIPAGGSRRPFSTHLGESDITMKLSDGKAVFAKAVAMMTATSKRALAGAGLGVSDVSHFLPHQANTRIIEATRKQLGIEPERVFSTVAEFGNSSAASIPFTLSHEANARGLKQGDVVLMAAAGAGLTGGGLVYRV